jgi:hypothetical protein
MRKFSTLLYYIVIIVCFTACSQYNVIGSSDLSDIDGRTLYMKTIGIDSLTTVDSCSIIHGKFKFSGSLDSTRIVTLCIDNTPILPVVLEEGEVRVTLNDQKQESTGTPLNDSLTAFNKRYEALLSQFEDLEHTQNQGYMNGENMDSVNVILATRQRQLLMKEDELVTSFISANFDNCLGPYVLQLATSNYRYPVLVPWIEALMTKASQKFKDAPYVKEYMGVAKQNQDIMTGVK